MEKGIRTTIYRKEVYGMTKDKIANWEIIYSERDL
jgi:hypothetical protein